MYNQMAFMIVLITNIMYKRQDKITQMTPNPTLIVSARAHAQFSSYQDTCKVTYHMHEITCTLLYMHTEISSYVDRSKWINRNFFFDPKSGFCMGYSLWNDG